MALHKPVKSKSSNPPHRTLIPEVITIPEQTKEEHRNSLVIVDAARRVATRIASDDQLAIAAEILTTKVRPALASIKSDFEPILRQIRTDRDSLLATVKSLQSRYEEPYAEAKQILDDAILAYRDTKKQLVEQSRQALANTLREASEQAITQEADELFASGKPTDARAARKLLRSISEGVELEVAIPTLPIKHLTPSAKGVSFRTYPKYRVIDESKINRRFLMPNHKMIQAAIEMSHKDAEKLVGIGSIEYYEEESIVSRQR